MINGLRTAAYALLGMGATWTAGAFALGATEALRDFAVGTAVAAVVVVLVEGYARFDRWLDNPPSDWNLHG